MTRILEYQENYSTSCHFVEIYNWQMNWRSRSHFSNQFLTSIWTIEASWFFNDWKSSMNKLGSIGLAVICTRGQISIANLVVFPLDCPSSCIFLAFSSLGGLKQESTRCPRNKLNKLFLATPSVENKC